MLLITGFITADLCCEEVSLYRYVAIILKGMETNIIISIRLMADISATVFRTDTSEYISNVEIMHYEQIPVDGMMELGIG